MHVCVIVCSVALDDLQLLFDQPPQFNVLLDQLALVPGVKPMIIHLDRLGYQLSRFNESVMQLPDDLSSLTDLKDQLNSVSRRTMLDCTTSGYYVVIVTNMSRSPQDSTETCSAQRKHRLYSIERALFYECVLFVTSTLIFEHICHHGHACI